MNETAPRRKVVGAFVPMATCAEEDGMPKRRLAFCQCDLERAIRAAKATGAGAVMVRPDGTIVIEVEPPRRKERASQREEVVF